MRVLVGYASENGSTREIAERMAGHLRGCGHDAEALPLDRAGDVDAYEAAVLGSAVRGGSWIPAAAEYARRHAEALAGRPVWLFSVGTGHLSGDRPAEHASEPKEVLGLREAVGPREYRLFAGSLAPEHMTAGEREGYERNGGRYGDFRDWPEVDAWAGRIAAELLR
ncbi:flavodoxin domain-containing protein [Actinorugispora endophytica]|uniref:Menaquinone-dependent protoporphyrinogen oxidase n=1 Tax=Actinorugispora endophytica TaxID=1605990 RepID=A0A4V3D6K3_9ACTN|nr:flavodoxin domain-containing protein [Actinorugispora endophytica]TDQ44257.1 menaquinone-dependent protoporphyrinogen oxidase [Actinorugispora endophytica]